MHQQRFCHEVRRYLRPLVVRHLSRSLWALPDAAGSTAVSPPYNDCRTFCGTTSLRLWWTAWRAISESASLYRSSAQPICLTFISRRHKRRDRAERYDADSIPCLVLPTNWPDARKSGGMPTTTGRFRKNVKVPWCIHDAHRTFLAAM